jgi:hypothetical protein
MKVAIIEDREKRLQRFQSFDIYQEPNVVVVTEQLFQDVLENLRVSDLSFLDTFGVIAIHRSALSESMRDSIKNYCAKEKKPLVFFSGGITSSYYKETTFPFLMINSKEFYSDHLKIFLDHLNTGAKPNLLMLQFGIKWKLSMFLSLRNRIVVSLSKEELKASGMKNIGGVIKWVSDLDLSELIMSDIQTEDTKEALAKKPDASVTSTELVQIKIAIEQLLQRMS